MKSIEELHTTALTAQHEADKAFTDYMSGKDKTSHKATRRQNKADDLYAELYTHPDYNPNTHKMEGQ